MAKAERDYLTREEPHPGSKFDRLLFGAAAKETEKMEVEMAVEATSEISWDSFKSAPE